MDDNKHNVSISAKLYKEIKDYCTLNELKVNVFVEELLRKAFNVEKFGDAPFIKFREGESGQESGQSVQIPPKQPQITDEYVKMIDSKKHEMPDEPINELNDEPNNEPNEPITEPKPKKTKKITRLN